MKLVLRMLAAGLVALGLAYAGWTWWLDQPLALKTPKVRATIEQGANARDIARDWVDSGVQTSPWLLAQWFKWSGASRKIRAGVYSIDAGTTPRTLLEKMLAGAESLATVRFIEGWTFRQLRATLAQAEDLKVTTAALSDSQLMDAVGAPKGQHPEGRFFPDTYHYQRGSTDLALLKEAYRTMHKRLDEAWSTRSADSPLKSPDEALTLASIVEKETGRPEDRSKIAGVFNNRLRIRMPLQTDPTVIYGLGDKFDGNLRRKDLQTDTPYNTYTRNGLPPTPIALPSKAALMAAVQPESDQGLVLRGPG